MLTKTRRWSSIDMQEIIRKFNFQVGAAASLILLERLGVRTGLRDVTESFRNERLCKVVIVGAAVVVMI